jgi:hypothetical protein
MRGGVNRNLSSYSRHIVGRRIGSGAVMLLVVLAGCREVSQPRPQAEYDPSGKLRLLIYDSDGNRQPDTWAHMDGARVLRIEIDQDEDGAVDRREYYGPDQSLEEVGISHAGDGRPGTWTYVSRTSRDGRVSHVVRSETPDGRGSRTEFFEDGFLVRAEEDGDGNGAVDKWETYTNGRVSSVVFDVAGDERRLVYAGNRAATGAGR